MVKRVEDMPRRIKEAFEIATSGRPGPVLVDLPKDVCHVQSLCTHSRIFLELLLQRHVLPHDIYQVREC